MTQTDALTILKAGYHVFLTGSAGSGKTYTLNTYIQYLRDHSIPVAITASTGIAATHIGGMTIHAWSGIGIRDAMSAQEIEALLEKEYLWKRFKTTKVLVIDEISMLGAKRFDLINRVCKAMKQSDAPFGGMQIVVCGDFFQLPPIDAGDAFAYESEAWQELEFKVCYLEEQHRHTDNNLHELLNAFRASALTDRHHELLDACHTYTLEDHIEPTRLYTHNANVDAMNAQELEKLPGEIHTYTMETRGKPIMVEGLKKSCLAPEVLELKKGALVMFVKNNYEQGFVNGTMGRVTGFDRDDAPIVETFSGETIIPNTASWMIEENGKILAEINQFPLRLAWAITIHKSQGMSLDAAEIDLSSAFVAGQGYVALSRVRSLAGLFLKGINDIAISVHPAIATHDKKFQADSNYVAGSLVAFTGKELELLHTDFITQMGGTLERVPRTVEKPKAKISTYAQTLALLQSGISLEEIAKTRGVTLGTIIGHIEKLHDQKQLPNIHHLRPAYVEELVDAFESMGTDTLKPIFEFFDGKYSYDQLKLARIFVK